MLDGESGKEKEEPVGWAVLCGRVRTLIGAQPQGGAHVVCRMTRQLSSYPLSSPLTFR